MRRERLIYLVLFLVTAAVYWPVVQFKFTNFDDWAYAGENPFVLQGLTIAGVSYAFQTTLLGNWHPVTWLSHMLDAQLFGAHPGAYHLVNLFFHVANTLLLFHLLQRMSRELWPSALVAALFALHPLHVESVAWIAERKDVLSTFFGLLTIEAYLCYAWKAEDGRQKAADGIRTSVLRALTSGSYWLALFFFALGLMSKPMLVTWPFVLLLLDFWPLDRIPGLRVQHAGSPVSTAPTLTALSRLVVEKLPFFALTIASSAITLITQRMAGAIPDSEQVTVSMSVDNALASYVRYIGKTFWPHDLVVYYPYNFHWPEWKIIGSVMILALITLGAWWQRHRRPCLIFGWLWFLGTLVPVIGLVQAGAQSMADRYMYIPSIGLLLTIVWAGKDFLGRWPLAQRRVGAAAAAAALLGCLLATGTQLRYWRDGETLFRRAIDLTPNSMMAQYGLGDALVRAGKPEEGLQHLERAVQIKPECVEGIVKIADLWSRQGRIRESIDQYHQALHYHSNNVPALNNLAWLLATSEDPALRNGAEAVQLAERACEAIPYEPPDQVPCSLDTLAAAYAEVGRYEDAVKTASKARALALSQGQKQRAQRIRQSIELYRAGKPLHQKVEQLKK